MFVAIRTGLSVSVEVGVGVSRVVHDARGSSRIVATL